MNGVVSEIDDTDELCRWRFNVNEEHQVWLNGLSYVSGEFIGWNGVCVKCAMEGIEV